MSARLRIGGLVAALAVLAAVMWRSWLSVQAEIRATEVCEYAEAKRFAEAAAHGAGAGLTGEGASCLCLSFLVLGNRPACVELAQRQASQDLDWVPDGTVARVLVEDAIRRRDVAGALAVVRRFDGSTPDADVLIAEMRARDAAQDAGLDADLLARVATWPCCDARHRAVSDRVFQAAAGQALLGALPANPPDGPGRADWLYARATALGVTSNQAALELLIRSQEQAGVHPAFLSALLIHLDMKFQIGMSPSDTFAHAERVIATPEAVGDIGLVASAIRRAEQFAVLTRDEEKLAYFVRRGEELGFESKGVQASAQFADSERGDIIVDYSGSGTVLVSPDADADVMAAFETLPGRARLQRRLGAAAVRFLVLSPDGSPCGSASAWPAPGTTVRVTLRDDATCRPRLQFVKGNTAGDGRRRVFAVLLDSGDWRIVRLLQARGEAPVLSMLEARGVTGILHSDPPGTSPALRKLTFPDRSGRSGVLAFIDDVGTQVTVIAGTDAHPWPALAALTPQPRSLFDVIGEQSVAVNLLGARGGLGEGHGQVTGPRGARRMLALKAPRVPTDDEARAFRGLWGDVPSLNDAVAEMASLFDTLTELARDGSGDLVLARVDATDVAAHVRFHEYALGTKDDETHLLAAYRYADHRIGELWNALDDDDTLVVFSDHGTINELEHDRQALWLAQGPEVRAGILQQPADIAGVARTLAELVIEHVPASWPDPGVALLPRVATQRDEAGAPR